MNISKLILSLIKTSALAGIIYFSAVLAFQINAGGDVKYWISIFIALGILIYSLIEIK